MMKRLCPQAPAAGVVAFSQRAARGVYLCSTHTRTRRTRPQSQRTEPHRPSLRCTNHSTTATHYKLQQTTQTPTHSANWSRALAQTFFAKTCLHLAVICPQPQPNLLTKDGGVVGRRTLASGCGGLLLLFLTPDESEYFASFLGSLFPLEHRGQGTEAMSGPTSGPHVDH